MKKQENDITGIYRITNPKGKIYIGQSINIKRRFNSYKKLRCKSQPKIYNSLKKYGSENHIFEIIEECNVNMLCDREIYWKLYHLNNFDGNWEEVLFCELYDIGSGGYRSEETKRKIGLSNSKPNPKNSIKLKGRKAPWVKSPNIKGEPLWSDGRSHSIYYTEDIRRKISESNKGKIISQIITDKINYGKSKPILQFNLNGEFIREWGSIKEACIELDMTPSDIVSNLKGRRKRVKQYKFKYKYENGKTNNQQDIFKDKIKNSFLPNRCLV